MQSFKNLEVWKKAHQLTLEVYRVTVGFPSHERFGLAAHLRKTALSIGSNLAEGCVRDGDAEFARFVIYALGSASELEYQLLLAFDLKFLEADVHERMSVGAMEVKRMLTSLLKKLRRPDNDGKSVHRMDR